MAATAWAFYNEAKHKICIGSATGGINLSSDVFNLALFKSAVTAPAETATLSVFTEISNQCTGGAYTAGGKTLSNTTWAATAATTQKFDGDDWVITATGTTISAVKYAVLFNSISPTSGFLLCWSKLSTSPFDVTTGNTLTVQINNAGIFTLA
jgi:hypothetical protein